MLDTLRQDIRFATRTLGRSPGFTIAAVATLGLGIGATALVFSMVNAMVIRPFPYHEPDRLVMVDESDTDVGEAHIGASYPNFLSWRALTTSFEALSAFHERSISMRVGNSAENFDGAAVSANIFDVLGVRPIAGRSFLPDEDLPGSPKAVMLSHDLWVKQFAGAAIAVGSTVYVDAEAHTVVGIMPPDFGFPSRAEMWVPFRLGESEDRGARYLRTIGRLRDGVSIEQAELEMAAVAERLSTEYPGPNQGHIAHVQGLQAGVTRETDPYSSYSSAQSDSYC